MPVSTEEKEEQKKKFSKKQLLMFIAGLLAMLIGGSILSVMVFRRIRRDIQRQKLMDTNVVIEIPDLRLKAPVLEGTEQEILAQAVGHFPETGSVGKGNYCIAGHSSPIYKEYFNCLKEAQNGMLLYLYDVDKNKSIYEISEHFIVNPDETWILDDFNDDRVTLVTCTDDGSQRLITIAKLCPEETS